MRRAQGDGLGHCRVLLRSRLNRRTRWSRRLGRAAAIVAALGVTAFAATARAGDEQPLLGNEAAISAGAVVAAGSSVGMAWYNPAGLGSIRRSRMELSSEVFALRLLSLDRGLTTELPDRAASADLRSRELVIVPGASVWAFRISRRATAAVGVFVPTFDAIDVEVFQRRRGEPIELAQQLGVQHAERRYHVGPSVGWEITPELRLGVSGWVVYDRVSRSTRLAAWAFDVDSGAERFVQTSTSESIRSWGGELVAGLQWSPTPHADLGLAVRSGQLWLTQRRTTSGVASQGGNDGQGNNSGDLDFIALDAGVVRPRDPLQVDGGVAFHVKRTTLAIDGAFGPPRRGDIDVARRGKLAVRAGVSARVGRRALLGAGVHASRSTAIVTDDLLDLDVHSWGLVAGGQWRRAVHLGSRERAPTLVFTPTLALHYTQSRGTGGRLRVDLTRLDQVDRDVDIVAGAPAAVRRHHLALHVGSGLEF